MDTRSIARAPKCLSVVFIVCLAPRLVAAETLRLPAVQDNSIVMVDGEWAINAGANSRIRIKGNQHIVAMSFNVSAIHGRHVKRAELICQASAESISGVTISTIAAPWDEMKSTGLTAGIDGLDGWAAQRVGGGLRRPGDSVGADGPAGAVAAEGPVDPR